MKSETHKKYGLITKHPRAMVLAGINTALLYALNFVSGQALSAVFAIPGLSGIVTGFTVPFFLSLTFLITRGYGTFTVMWTLYSVAAIPTLLMGPPGPYKVLIGFIAGLVFDAVVFISNNKNRGLYFGFVLYTIAMMALFLSILHWLKLPGFDITTKAVAIITVVFIIEGIISIYAAIKTAPRMIRLGKDFSVTGD